MMSWWQRVFHSVALTLCACALLADGKRLWETILNEFSLHKMARVLEKHSLSGLFEADNMTVFLPSSEAYFSFQYEASSTFQLDYNNEDDLRQLLLYSSVHGRYLTQDLPQATTATLPSRLDPQLPLFVNNLQTNVGKVLSINGARILKANLVSDNGVIHVVSRVIAPVAYRSTLATYVESPPLPQFAFTSIYFARAVVPDLTVETNSMDKLFTSFSPNDSYITVMPDYGQTPLFENWTLLRLVYQAHVVKGNALFLPDGVVPKDEPSLYGTLKFSRKKNDVYVSNGRVRARVVQPNIPVLNGVLHVIDNLLYYIYRDVIQMVTSLPNTRKMAELLERAPQELQTMLKSTDQEFTVMVPTDFAFAKLPTTVQRRFETDPEFLKHVLLGHIISDVDYDVDALSQRSSVVTMNGKTLLIRNYGGEVFLEWGELRSQLEVTDLGVTNGIVHLVDTVLFVNNFTVWEAMSNLPILSRSQELVQQFSDVVDVLSDESRHVTVFLANDDVMTRVSPHVTQLLKNSRDLVYNAVLGHISRNNFSSHHTHSPVKLTTLAGTQLTITFDPESKDIFVQGSHVTAKVVVKNVWCTNGVIFIIDELLHLPTRTIMEELKRRPELKYMRTLFESLKDDAYNFSDPTRDYTVFVANNDAFSHLPWPSIDKLMRELDKTKIILRAHIVPEEHRFMSELRQGEKLTAIQNVIYVLTKKEKRYVINNNLWAEVVTPDIPAVNGHVHIINRLLYIPYNNVSHLLNSREELRPFHSLMSEYADYLIAVEAEDRNVTLFIPSARFLRTVTSPQMDRIRRSPHILKRLYHGHILPQVRMDDVFLRQFPDKNIISKSSFNVTFQIYRSDTGVFVDGGYDRQILDVIGRAYGCTNGIIYVIDGFLNYSPLTILERLRREPSVSRSFEHMIQLPPPYDAEMLNAHNLTFTFLMPDDPAVDFLTFAGVSYLHNLRPAERQRVFWRHVLNGSEITYEELRHGHLDESIYPPGVSLRKYNTGLYFRYGKVISRIKRWNLVACNGVIHLITHYLYQPPTSPTSHPRASTPGTAPTPTPVKATGGSGCLGCGWWRVPFILSCSVLVVRTLICG